MQERIRVIDHPLVAARLTTMRDKFTDKPSFRASLSELTTMLVYEALRDAETAIDLVETPLAPAHGTWLSRDVVFVSILRAGLGMLESATRLVPDADIGFVGMARDEQTHEPNPYMETLPPGLEQKQVIVLDPMLATGGSLIACLQTLREKGARDITVICVLAAPEGVARVCEFDRDVGIVAASIDEKLDQNASIVPGLGDAGDRQFGVA